MTQYILKAKYHPLTFEIMLRSNKLGKEEPTLGDKILMEYAEKSLEQLCGMISFKSIVLKIEK